MGDGVTLEHEDVYYNQGEEVKEIATYLTDTHDAVKDLLTNSDKRIRDYYKAHFDSMRSANGSIYSDIDVVPEIADWIEETTDDYVETKRATEELAGADPTGGTGGGTPPSIGGTVTPEDTEHISIDPEVIQALPPEVQQQIVDELADAGYSEQEIEDILAGNIPVDKATTEKLEQVLEDAIAANPEVAKIVEEATGFPLIDENGNVDVNRLAIAELIAAKNLGMDIDMSPGSPFKRHINELSLDIIKVNRDNPDLRQAIIDTYGIDIFNEDGTIDQNKLALIRVIDGQDLNDDYDIVGLIDKYRIDPAGGTVGAEPGTGPGSGGGDVDPSTPTPPGGGGGGTGTTGDVGSLGGSGLGGVGSGLGADGKGIAASITDGLGAVGEGILGAIDKGASKLASITPYKAGSGSTVGVNANKATAGIIAAASVAAGGAAAGGGVLIHKKVSVLRFTPDDWKALGEDYQGIIEKLMKKVGFSEDEIETFKNSRFKITTAEMREHTKKIDKAIDANPTCEDELLKLYNYSFFDENERVIDYLLFITMIIDGKNSIDEYNMYNVINQSFENVDEADFIYSGIAMEDYYDETAPDDDDAEVKILNDPTAKEEKPESSEPEGELEEENPSIDKEWLKGIGIDE